MMETIQNALAMGGLELAAIAFAIYRVMKMQDEANEREEAKKRQLETWMKAYEFGLEDGKRVEQRDRELSMAKRDLKRNDFLDTRGVGIPSMVERKPKTKPKFVNISDEKFAELKKQKPYRSVMG